MNPSPATPLNTPSDAQVARLRSALRNAHALVAEGADPMERRRAGRELDGASDLVIDVLSPSLLLRCTHLVRRAGKTGLMDGDDLAQEAWSLALAYLRDEIKGERVQTGAHFKNLLFRCAQTHMVDLGRRRAVDTTGDSFTDPSRTETRTEQMPAPLVLPDVLRHATQSEWAEWLDVLFSGTPLEFREACRGRPRRRPVVYQAFVLISLAGFLRVLQAESGAPAQSGSALLRELARYLNIPARFWEIAETAARAAPPLNHEDDERTKPDAGVNETVIENVCGALNVSAMSRNLYHVLRNEARTFATGREKRRCMVELPRTTTKNHDYSND